MLFTLESFLIESVTVLTIELRGHEGKAVLLPMTF